MLSDLLGKLEYLNLDELRQVRDRVSILVETQENEMRAKLIAEFEERAKSMGISFRAPTTRSGSGDAPLILPVKYRGPNGETWAGRGVTPKWLEGLEASGHNRDEYLVNKDGSVAEEVVE